MNHKIETDSQTHRKWTGGCQRGGGWRLGERGEGTEKYRLVVTK